jgi:hypothetical protein
MESWLDETQLFEFGIQLTGKGSGPRPVAQYRGDVAAPACVPSAKTACSRANGERSIRRTPVLI